MKRDYGLKVFSRAYEKVDLVYILDTATVKGKCRKLRTSWRGPGIVIKKLSPYLYRVKTKTAVMVANHDHLKKCVNRDIPLWLSRYREKFRSPMPEREEVPVSQSPDLSSDTDVYCFCRRPDDSRRMVQCDQCDGWFHGECVGVTNQEVADLDQYICPSCMGNGSWIRCLLLSFIGSSDEDTGSPTCRWANERQRYRST